MAYKTISLMLPVPELNFSRLILSLKAKILKVFWVFWSVLLFLKGIVGRVKTRTSTELGGNEEEKRFRIISLGSIFKLAKLLVVALIFLAIALFLQKITPKTTTPKSEKIEVKEAKAAKDINKEFNFSLRDEKGKEVGKINFWVEKAELRDEIVVKGQKATAIKGRTFLILTLKITNEYKSDIELDSGDYIRLSVNGNKDEWLAPEIHNDPVKVQAISTKYTRVGFAINDSDRNLVLRVGEIEGEKEEIPLEF